MWPDLVVILPPAGYHCSGQQPLELCVLGCHASLGLLEKANDLFVGRTALLHVRLAPD